MTRTAHVNFRDDGFWAYDVAGSVFLWFLIDAANKRLSSHDEPWLREMVQHWRVAAFITEMAHYTDDNWTTSQVDLVIQLSRHAIDAIRSHGDFAASDVQSWPVLDENRIFARGHDPIPAEPVARLGDAFIQLLQGQLPAPPDQHWWFYTLELETDTIKMRSS